MVSRARTLRRHDGRGFTLVEVMMAMVLTAIIITSVVALLMSQVKYVSQINGDVRALDQINTVQDLLSEEIERLPRGAMTFARSDSLVMRLPLSWGVVCGTLDRYQVTAPPVNRKTKTGAVIPVYSTTAALALEPSTTAINSPTPDGIAVADDGTNFTFYAVPTWSTLNLKQDTLAALACMRSTPLTTGKSGNVKNLSAVVAQTKALIGNFEDYSSASGYPTVTADTPDERSLFLTYLTVGYYFKSDANGAWLYRTSKQGTQKVAGPFAPSASFAFRLSDGTSNTSVVTASLPNIRAIRTNLPALRLKRELVKADTLNVQPWRYMFNAR